MTVKREEPGRRFVEVEVEVPGTPEEVWRAIATGPGISSWFVPAEVDECVGGEIKCSFGPGMDSVSTITEWDPPRRVDAESRDLGPDGPPVATEWTVEARSGRTCVVRVVHSIIATSDDWDDELQAWEGGWPDFFRILRLYLTYFVDQPAALLQLGAGTTLPPQDAWNEFATALGIGQVSEGDRCQIEVADLPSFAAVIERVGRGAPHAEEVLMRTEEPMAGLAHGFALKMGEKTYVSLRLYLYGDSAAESAERFEPSWSAWMNDRFPAS